MKCLNCKYARQAANKKTDVVGCSLMTFSENPESLLKSYSRHLNIYEGYVYFGRRVGDIGDTDVLGKGVITLGYLVDSEGVCPSYITKEL